MAITDEITIIGLEERDRWEHEHARDGLPTQSWGYSKALAASGVEPELAVVRAKGARMLMAFHRRSWQGTTDIATILGLSGASISPGHASSPLALWREYATQQGWVAGYLQLSPFTELRVPPGGDELVTSNEVFILDLKDRNPLASASRMIKRKVRRAINLGVELERDPVDVADALVRLYPPSHARRGAGRLYDFHPRTLEAWVHDDRSIALGCRVGGSIEAVSVTHLAGETAEYHVNASTEAGRELDAWLIGQAVRLLRERGIMALNVGGGVRPGDGIHAYKERFHGSRRPLRSVRQIYRPDKFEELCRIADASSDSRFPPYRVDD